MATKDGGYGHPVPATKDTQDLCDQVKIRTGKKYQEYKAVKYRREDVSRFVAGTNYLIKVHVGGEDYIHLIVFGALNGGEVSLTNAKDHQTKDSPLKTF
ncbi:cystatin-A5-like [Perca flavescens]|uniref:cystatin-A5-like n=1 Tax=Perca flavescens TaxID=8167 RepID=UPI00106E7A26|nr:cystatin-A5-like [Perca flavescens]